MATQSPSRWKAEAFSKASISIHLSKAAWCAVFSDLLDGKEQADGGGSQQRAADAASAVAFEILAAVGGGGAAAAITFKERAQTYSKAAYFDRGEVLVRVGVPNVDEVAFSYDTASISK
jgi:hypothetical protein